MKIQVSIAYTEEQAIKDFRWFRHLFYSHWFCKTNVEPHKWMCLECCKLVTADYKKIWWKFWV